MCLDAPQPTQFALTSAAMSRRDKQRFRLCTTAHIRCIDKGSSTASAVVSGCETSHVSDSAATPDCICKGQLFQETQPTNFDVEVCTALWHSCNCTARCLFCFDILYVHELLSCVLPDLQTQLRSMITANTLTSWFSSLLESSQQL